MKSLNCLILLVIMASLQGCGRRPVCPQIESLKIDTLFCEGETTFEISYDFATIANASRSEALEAIEQANILYFFGREEFPGTAAEAAQAALSEFHDQFTDTFDTPWTAYVTVASRAEVCDSLLVYTISREEYTGGAHGMRSVEYHNYSLAGGYELATGDLFTPVQTEALAALVHSKLWQIYLVQDDEGLTKVGFFPEQIALTENFRVTEEGITFLYNPYEIACYAIGMVEVLISNEELAVIRQKHN